MKSYKYFIFDLDGTLVDSSPSIYASIRATEKALGLVPVAEAELHRFVGPPLALSFEQFYGATAEQLPVMLNAYRKDYKENTSGLSKSYPGVTELLEHIRANGCHAAIATLKNREAAEVTVAQMQLAPHIDIMTALADDHNVTKGRLILECMEHYGNPPKEQVVFFGDSPYDGVGAQDAGVDFVALTYGFGFLEPGSLQGIPLVFEAKEPLELLEFVKRTAKGE